MADQAEALEWSLVQILTPPTTSWVTLSNTLSSLEPSGAIWAQDMTSQLITGSGGAK